MANLILISRFPKGKTSCVGKKSAFLFKSYLIGVWSEMGDGLLDCILHLVPLLLVRAGQSQLLSFAYFYVVLLLSLLSFMFCIFVCFCPKTSSDIQSNKKIYLFLLSPWDVLLVLDLHPPTGEDDRVLLAVAEVEEHPWWTLSHWNIQSDAQANLIQRTHVKSKSFGMFSFFLRFPHSGVFKTWISKATVILWNKYYKLPPTHLP